MEDTFYPSAHGRIHCRETGSGVALFLMHSNGRSAHEFDEVAALLAEHFRVISWDMPGHGDSDRPDRYLSVKDLAALAVDLACGVGGGPPIVGGSSIGASVALAAGAFHGQQLRGIVPIELPISRAGRWWQENWPLVELMFGRPEEDPAAVAKRYRTVTPMLARRLQIDRHKAGAAAMMRVLWAGRTDADETHSRIAALRVTSLFVNGDRGLATDAGDALPQLNSRAQLSVIANCGHFPQTDDPDSVAAAIRTTFSSPSRLASDNSPVPAKTTLDIGQQ